MIQIKLLKYIFFELLIHIFLCDLDKIKKKLQDAYALCRVFKKSLNGPKIVEQNYGTTASDHSSSVDLYSEGRCEDMETCEYPMQSPPCSTNINIQGSPHNNIGGSTSDGRWMQYLSDEALNFTNTSFPNYGAAVPYPPSKVNKKIFIVSAMRSHLASSK